jgi:hypothetical protein
VSAKTRFDYRNQAEKYVRPALGARKVRDVTPDVVLAWQRKLLKGGGVKSGKALARTRSGLPGRRWPAP